MKQNRVAAQKNTPMIYHGKVLCFLPFLLLIQFSTRNGVFRSTIKLPFAIKHYLAAESSPMPAGGNHRNNRQRIETYTLPVIFLLFPATYSFEEVFRGRVTIRISPRFRPIPSEITEKRTRTGAIGRGRARMVRDGAPGVSHGSGANS